ncbi:hypothetical protein AcV5_003426 [Taiwanofungus camphoratus]|nr:hypothetical protein AcV5_003426 [Antrodia cinnamomea]
MRHLTALEVSTDVPPPPTVAIISPTPRAFTFPINDAPFASPSSSPFEPDLKSATPPPARTLSPTSSIGSDSSSVLSTPTSRSSQASHKRRRSTASDIGERRPKKGDEDYIKRPENAFILFRRKCCEERQAQDDADDNASGPVKKQRQADLSKTISQQWKTLSSEERQYWEGLAKEKKKEHEAMYPNYVYRPQRVKDKAKAKKGKGRKADGEGETDADSISFILPVPSPPRSLSRDNGHSGRGHARRAVSAPTPPPQYQTIQLPTVYMPSCPTSPSLVPRISRRSPHIPPPTDSDPLMHFENLPNDTLFPPSFHQPSMYETNVPSHELLQNMFQVAEHAAVDKSSNSLLHSLMIPQESSTMPSSMQSPAESIVSSQFMSPVESYASQLSPSSPQSMPFSPSESLSMMSLSIANHQSDRHTDGIPENVGSNMQPSEMSYSSFSWQNEQSLWPEDTMLPDDFDLSAIPPIELGISKFDGEMQLAALSSGVATTCEFEGGNFVSMAGEHDLHDANPGHDPFAMFSYDDNMTW